MRAAPRVEAVKHLSPHPEEAALLGGRLEGWIHGPDSLPSFETRASKSAVADFDTFRLPKSGRPDFGARSSERVKESPEGVARPQNVEYSTPKWGSRESKFPPGDLCRNVILPRHPKFDSFSRSH